MWLSRIAACFGAIGLALSSVQYAAAELLISEAEAKLPAMQETAMATRGLTRGPGIEVISPASSTASKSPLPLKIKFLARNNIAIDPSSVRLTYLKSPAVDLTNRIKAHVSKDGVDMASAEVPPGTHLLRLDLKDTEGRTATTTITLSVAPK